MNTKYFKNIFFITIFLLVVAGIYIVYLKDNNKQNSVQAPIIESLSEVGQRIIEKLKELQVQV